jgi:hypothetical protein
VSAPPPPADPAGDTLEQAFFRERPKAVVSDAPREPGRRMLRRVALRALIVLLLLAAGDLLVRLLVPPESLLPWMDREFASYTVKVDRFEHAPAPDLLFLGNSRVHEGIVPSVFADALQQSWGRPVRVFNLGLMNAKAEEFAAIVRGHLPDPPPARIVFGISGTEFTHVDEFQYASRFLWSATDVCDYLHRTPASRIEREHVENWLEAAVGKAWYCFAERDALQAGLEAQIRSLFGQPDENRAVRLRVSRYNRMDALSADGTSNEGVPQSNLASMLAAGDDVRIPPYSLGDTREITRGADFPLMRAVLTELAARGCRVALVEVPPSPWLQEQAPEFHGDPFRQRMAEFAGSLGLPFVPMPPSTTLLGNDAYVDANHLSHDGAARFSAILVKRLAATGFFEG